MNAIHLYGAAIDTSRKRGQFIRGRQKHTGQKVVDRDVPQRGPWWPDTYNPEEHPEKSLEEMLQC
jgi:Mg2+ and Co2+ transporter CorA